MIDPYRRDISDEDAGMRLLLRRAFPKVDWGPTKRCYQGIQVTGPLEKGFRIVVKRESGGVWFRASICHQEDVLFCLRTDSKQDAPVRAVERLLSSIEAVGQLGSLRERFCPQDAIC